LTPEVAKALAENRPDQVIPMDMPANVSMQEVLQPVQRLATPSDNYYMEDKLQGYVQRILGISELQMGQIDVASRVPATAAAAVEGATTTRALEKMTAVERASREIGTRMLGLCQQFIAEDKALRIAGPNAPQWLQVSAADIDGEFSIEAEGGSTQAINPASRARQGMDILNGIVPALAQLGYDPEPALRTALGYMGLNADHLLVRPEPAPQPDMQGQGGMPPGMPGGPGGGIPPELMQMMQNGGMSPELNNPDLQQLADMGGPPIPAAGTGEVMY